jgi:carbamoyl-phosphate synthase large subunit
VFKIGEGKPDVVDLIKQKNLSLVINTPSGKRAMSDGYMIRRTSLDFGVPIITNINSCQAAIQGVSAVRKTSVGVKSLQDHYATLPYPVEDVGPKLLKK